MDFVSNLKDENIKFLISKMFKCNIANIEILHKTKDYGELNVTYQIPDELLGKWKEKTTFKNSSVTHENCFGTDERDENILKRFLYDNFGIDYLISISGLKTWEELESKE